MPGCAKVAKCQHSITPSCAEASNGRQAAAGAVI